jgi:hypothetical protein
MSKIQCFATLDDLQADLGVGNIDAKALEKYLRPASDYLAEEIGHFIPEIATGAYYPYGYPRMLFIAPLISVTSISNDGTTLSASDYILKPDRKHWSNGCYTWIEIAADATGLDYWTEVSIVGKWGMYDETKATGATVGTGGITDSATALLVNDGAKVSPGQVLYIGTEQLFVSGYGAVTASATTLGADLDASSETVSVASGAALNVGEIIRVGFEAMKVLDIQSNSLYVTRGWNGTKKVTHATSAAVDVYRTFTVERGVNGTTAAAHAEGATINYYTVPTPINYLTRQIATLMMKKAQGGFAGKTGNSTVGDVFYFHEFPRDEIARVKNNYYVPRQYVPGV